MKASQWLPSEYEEDLDPVRRLRQIARDKVDAFCGTIRPDGTYKDRIYQSAQSTSKQIGEEYGDRFLIELIQNAYDAHAPDDQAGGVAVRFAPTEGEYGVLYVANRGRSFSDANVRALCDVGLSDKHIGQTIGNKGLGFRSVRYVSDDPQIFSRRRPDESGPLDGFCFRFARGDDFDPWVENDLRRSRIKADSPQFWVPLPLVEQPDAVRPFADAGYATVIRFPLKSESARTAVREQIQDLKSPDAPVLLFLGRLARLEVHVDDDPDLSFVLERKPQPVLAGSSDKADSFSVVDLGALGRYFVAFRRVPESRVREAISESIQKELLDVEWLTWEGEGELALALRVDDGACTPRLYTYLPMGKEARAPFQGYLHAAFFAKVDRQTLDMKVPLNAFYFSEAVLLAVKAILALRNAVGSPGLTLSDPAVRRLVVDLLSWNDLPGFRGTAQCLAHAFEQEGRSLRHAPVAPVLPGANWTAPERVWRWSTSGCAVFTPERLAEVGAAILDPALGSDRLDRLEDLLGRLGMELTPEASALASLAEQIAERALAADAPLKFWHGFYGDVKDRFAKESGELFGRRILLGNDRRLHAAPRPATSAGEGSSAPARRRRGEALNIFFPPEKLTRAAPEAEEEIIKVPKSLQSGLAVLADLAWYTSHMQGARTFLESAGLVRRYSAENLIDQVAQRAAKSRSEAMRQQALRWVFRLYVASRMARRPVSLKRVRLRVPTVSGRWIPAGQAVFSAGWPKETLGERLDGFLNLTASSSKDLHELAQRRLLGPDHAPFDRKRMADWVDFLSDLGVKRGLQPVPLGRSRAMIYGPDFVVATLAPRLQVGPRTRVLWEGAVKRDGERLPYVRSNYVPEGSFWAIPGQEVAETWPSPARLLYAQLIVSWIAQAGSEHFSCRFKHDYYSNRFSWPTPLAAFLRSGAWVPVLPAGQLSAEMQFAAPDDTWLPDADEQLPRYMPMVALEVRRLLRQLPEATPKLAELCSVNLWGAEKSRGRQVAYLGRLYDAGGVSAYHTRAFANDYRDAWKALAATGQRPVWGGEPRFLVVELGDELRAIRIDAAGADASDGEAVDRVGVFVQDSDERLVVELLKTLRRPVVDFDPSTAELLRKVLGERCLPVSQVRLDVLIEGQPFDVDAARLLSLVEVCPSLSELTLLAAESLSGPTTLPADRTKILAGLQDIRLCLAHSVAFRLDGETVLLPPSERGAVAVPHPERPTVVLSMVSDTLRWDDLHRAAVSIASLMGHRALDHPLKLGFRTLERVSHAMEEPMGILQRQHVALELGLDARRVDEMLAPLRGDPAEVRRMLRVVAHYVGGEDAVIRLERIWEEHDAWEEVIAIFDEAHLEGAAVLEAARSAGSFAELYRVLSLDFGRFNKSLLALGEQPVQYPEAHQSALKNYVEQHRLEILDRLRQPHVEAFRRKEDLSPYVKARAKVNTVRPDDAWLLLMEVPAEEVLAGHVNQWLQAEGAPSLIAPASTLPPVEEVRMLNRRLLSTLVKAAPDVLSAWCLKHSVAVPNLWSPAESAEQRLALGLDQTGALDFDILSQPECLSWIDRMGAWPQGMPHSIALPDKVGAA